MLTTILIAQLIALPHPDLPKKPWEQQPAASGHPRQDS